MVPKTRYAKHGDLNLAYQVVGEGEIGMILSPSFVSHIEFFWGSPVIAGFLERVASFTRLVIFDKAGSGLSDPISSVPTVEERANELEAVMDAAGLEHAAIVGLSEGGPMAIYFSVTRPQRTDALILFGSFALIPSVMMAPGGVSFEEVRREAEERGMTAGDKPLTDLQIERLQRFTRHVEKDWGEGLALKELLPSQEIEGLGLMERLSASPSMARATFASAGKLDVAHLLGSVQAPTLVVHATDDLVPVQAGRMLARGIPGARMLEVEGSDHAPWLSSPDEIVGEIEQMLTGTRHAPDPQRVLATVLFTDIVGSTERAAELGDAAWRQVLERHDELTRRVVEASAGTAVKSTGDGFLATFDGPAAAIRCTRRLRDELASKEISIRAGLHTGEIERLGDDIGGMAVHIAARVCAHAGAGEILVSRTIGDLVVGSGLEFEDRGAHELKGVPGEWQLLAVTEPGRSGAATASAAGAEAPIIESARSAQRPSDRVAAAVARRAPGALRAALRFEGRRSRRRG